ncbi:hypothetical protein C6P45_004667 [Maudiozyma exigua]|uniref:Uncharacterized protein n=1 Tax=Maudiozyma exigua TaxID=34358 RepID=A0A9P7BA83_MAUEX|nr:hypothetical protein C6P45_004667 [Kazachstania exigua]
MRFGSRDKSDKIHIPVLPSTSSSGSSLSILGDLLTCKYDEMKQQDYETMSNNGMSAIKESYDSFISNSTNRVSSSLFSLNKNTKQTKYKQSNLPISVEEIQCINYNNIISGHISQSQIPTISSIGDVSPLFKQDMKRDTNYNEIKGLLLSNEEAPRYSSRKCSNEETVACQNEIHLNHTNVSQGDCSSLVEQREYQKESNSEDAYQKSYLASSVGYSRDVTSMSKLIDPCANAIPPSADYTVIKSTIDQHDLKMNVDKDSYKNLEDKNNQQILLRGESVSPASVIDCYLESEPNDLLPLNEEQIQLNSCREKYKALQQENDKLTKQNMLLASQLKSVSSDILQNLEDKKQGLTNSKLIFETITLKRQLAKVTEEVLELKTILSSQVHNI